MTPHLLNYCSGSGCLVNNDRPLPDDYDCDPTYLVPRGCSNIVCSRCGHRVKCKRGVKFVEHSGPRSEASIAEMYDRENPGHFQSSRLSVSAYFCRCERHEEFLPGQPLDDDDKMWLAAWRCAGHPILLSASTTFDGVDLAKSTIEQITENVLRGWTPEGTDPEEQARMRWSARLFYRVSNTELADDMLRIAFLRTCDNDTMTRARAVHFLSGTRMVVASWLAMELLREKRSLFADVPDPLTRYSADKTIEHTLWRTTDLLVPTPYREFLRQEALAGRVANVALYQTLARYDSAWFVEHAGELAVNSPEPEILRGKGLDWLPVELRASTRSLMDQALAAR